MGDWSIHRQFRFPCPFFGTEALYCSTTVDRHVRNGYDVNVGAFFERSASTFNNYLNDRHTIHIHAVFCALFVDVVWVIQRLLGRNDLGREQRRRYRVQCDLLPRQRRRSLIYPANLDLDAIREHRHAVPYLPLSQPDDSRALCEYVREHSSNGSGSGIGRNSDQQRISQKGRPNPSGIPTAIRTGNHRYHSYHRRLKPKKHKPNRTDNHKRRCFA